MVHCLVFLSYAKLDSTLNFNIFDGWENTYQSFVVNRFEPNQIIFFVEFHIEEKNFAFWQYSFPE